jgi:hypothetical protein
MTMRDLRLVSIEFETTLGAVYSFPDMDLDELESFLRNFTVDHDVTLVNVSRACLVVPSRIVHVIRVGGEERWRR